MDRPQEMYTKFCLKKLNGILSVDLRMILPYFSTDNARVIYTKKGLNS